MAGGNFGGGNGTAENPYLIEDAHDLNAIRNSNLGSHYKQVADIDCSSYNPWVAIGSFSTPFNGYYDGSLFKIKNLYINGDNSGLFIHSSANFNGMVFASGEMRGTPVSPIGYSTLTSAIVRNCSNIGLSLVSGGGSAICYRANKAYDCYNTANHTATTFFYTISRGNECHRSYNTGNITISSGDCCGVSSGYCYDCYNTGNISAVNSPSVYGVSGGNSFRCYNTGDIISNRRVHGVTSTYATDCYNTGNLTSRNEYVSGICMSGATNCYNTGILTGFSSVYGISGSDGLPSSINAVSCFNFAPKICRYTGSTSKGSFYTLGKNANAYTNCYYNENMYLEG